MSLPYESKLIDRAKQLRRDATKQENHLWYDYLKDYPLRFQRQKAIGNYIVDFYCHKAGLVVELDGSQHYEEDAMQYDVKRTEYLNTSGLRVLRILNIDVDRNFEGVCMEIDKTVHGLLGEQIIDQPAKERNSLSQLR